MQTSPRNTDKKDITSPQAKRKETMAKVTTRTSKRLSAKQPTTASSPLPAAPAKKATTKPASAKKAAGKARAASTTPTHLPFTTTTPQAASTPITPQPLILMVDTKPHEKTFSLNRAVFTTHSKLLQQASLEAPRPDLAIVLPGIRALDFEVYLNHYSPFRRDLRALADEQWEHIKPAKCTLSPAQEIHVRVATLLGFWVMGNTLQDSDFKNIVMDALLQEDLAGEAGAAVVQTAGCILGYQMGMDSGLYRLLLDVMAPMVTDEFVDEWSHQWSKAFTVHLLKRVVLLRGEKLVEAIPILADKQRYYEGQEEVVERLVDAIE